MLRVDHLQAIAAMSFHHHIQQLESDARDTEPASLDQKYILRILYRLISEQLKLSLSPELRKSDVAFTVHPLVQPAGQFW